MTKKIRSRFLIKPALQIGITLQIMSILALFILVLIGFMYFIAHESVPMFENSVIRRQFEESAQRFVFELLAATFLVLISVFFLGIYVTHRVAGSLFAIERYLDQLLEGKSDLEDLQLRKNSKLQPLADKINRLRTKLK